MAKTITLTEFVKKYYGKAIDYDTVPEKDPVQCVDLNKAYAQECLGITTRGKGVSAWGNARDWFENFENIKPLQKKLFKIKNTKTFVPIKGDMCVFTEHNKLGHICIAEGEATVDYMITYDQNFGGKAMKKVRHTYNEEGFLGVLRPYRTIRADVNIRKGAGTNYKVVGELKKGDTIKILELDKTKRWARIDKGLWVAYSYVNSIGVN